MNFEELADQIRGHCTFNSPSTVKTLVVDTLKKMKAEILTEERERVLECIETWRSSFTCKSIDKMIYPDPPKLPAGYYWINDKTNKPEQATPVHMPTDFVPLNCMEYILDENPFLKKK